MENKDIQLDKQMGAIKEQMEALQQKMQSLQAEKEKIEKEKSEQELKNKLSPILDTHHNVCVFVASCWLLPNVFTVLKNWKKRIPDDIGLMGFDSLEWTELSSPTVTTIVQPAFEEGYLAGQVLIDRIEGKNEMQPNHILKCRINEMYSTSKGEEK